MMDGGHSVQQLFILIFYFSADHDFREFPVVFQQVFHTLLLQCGFLELSIGLCWRLCMKGVIWARGLLAECEAL